MPRKSNKTAHVLSLLTKDTKSAEDEKNFSENEEENASAETGESSVMQKKQRTPKVNISNDSSDLVSELIKDELMKLVKEEQGGLGVHEESLQETIPRDEDTLSLGIKDMLNAQFNDTELNNDENQALLFQSQLDSESEKANTNELESEEETSAETTDDFISSAFSEEANIDTSIQDDALSEEISSSNMDEMPQEEENITEESLSIPEEDLSDALPNNILPELALQPQEIQSPLPMESEQPQKILPVSDVPPDITEENILAHLKTNTASVPMEFEQFDENNHFPETVSDATTEQANITEEAPAANSDENLSENEAAPSSIPLETEKDTSIPAVLEENKDIASNTDITEAVPAKKPEKEFFCVNIFEELVKERVIPIMEQIGVCTCDKCVQDTMAIALNNLPPKYIVTEKGRLLAILNVYTNQHAILLTAEITRACMIVKVSPRHEMT